MTRNIELEMHALEDQELEIVSGGGVFVSGGGAFPASDAVGDLFSFMTEYQKMANKEAREDRKSARADQLTAAFIHHH